MKQLTITSSNEQIPFTDLYVSELNPRTEVNDAGIEALSLNIAEHGLIQNLAGLRDANGKVGIVAGGRRYRALALLQDDPRFHNIEVKVAPDQATAEFWASSENSQREALHPADEIHDYGAMERRGVSVPSIAMAYGVTEAHVYRRLALANLPAPVLEALKAGEISLSGAAAFTISDDEKRSLEVLEQVRGSGNPDHYIKRQLKPDSVSQTDRRAAFVGVDAYKEAGGRVGGDLFTEETLFDDPAILAEVFEAKLAEAAEAVTAEGWKWAEAVTSSYVGWYEIEQQKLARIYAEQGELTEDEAARYDALEDLANGDVLDEAGVAELAALQTILDGAFSESQKAVAGVMVYVNTQGQLCFEAGLVRNADKKEAQEAGILEKSHHGGSTTPKSPISQKLADDLSRVATGARQHAALRDPDMVLALLAYQLTGKMGHRKAFGLRADDVPNMPTTEAEGYALDARLTTPASAPKDPWNSDLGRGFRSFKSKGMEHVLDELHRHLAALLTTGDENLAGLIDKSVDADVREVWTPTAENLFSRVGGPYMVKLLCELLDLKADDVTATSFAKLKKGEKAATLASLFVEGETRDAYKLTEAQIKRIDAWVPEGV